jgi:glycosyltransferase involved in cell wall biosynthesis
MRIVHFTNFYKPSVSGVVTSLINFRRGLINAGQEVFIFAPKFHDYWDKEAYIFRFPSVNLSEESSISLAFPIRGLMEPTMLGIRPEVIHSHHPILMGDMASVFAEKTGIPLVFTFHTQYEKYIQEYISIAPELSGKLAEAMLHRYLEKCDHVIAPTSSTRKLIESYKVNVPVTIIPTPLDLDKFRVVKPERVRSMLKVTDQKILLYLGRLSPEKNLAFLLKAFSKIRAAEPNTLLMIVGSGPETENLKSSANKLGISNAVIFMGPVVYNEVPSYMAAADLFLFPSMTETQGLVLVESMAAGTPVMALNTDVNAEILANGGGMLVDPDLDAFVLEVCRVLSDAALREEMREKALATAEKYQISLAVDRLLHVYQSVTRQPLAQGENGY